MSEIERWGMVFPGDMTELGLRLWRYGHDYRPVEKGGLGYDFELRFRAFQEATDAGWNVPESSRKVVWNRWNERMLFNMIKYRYTSVAGSGSCGKSDSAALFSMVEWLCAPTESLILVTSTTKDGAKKRVWKYVTQFWNSLESQWKRQGLLYMPGKMVASRAMLVGRDITGEWSEGLGIVIVAADKSSDMEAAKTLKGLKAPCEGKGKLRLVADELPDLGQSVLAAGLGNLNSNKNFKMVGLGNPIRKTDSFGQLSEPKEGWRSVTVMDDGWETSVGVCIRFDALKSPRITEPDGEEKYEFLPGQDYIDQVAREFGEDSAEYWAQVRGMFPPDGLTNAVWSEGELLSQLKTRLEFDGKVQPVSGLDIPYNSGGDRAVFVWGEAGLVKGRRCLQMVGYRVLTEGLTDDLLEAMRKEEEGMSANLHLIREFVAANRQLGISPRYTGFDATGGGAIWGHWLQKEWTTGCRDINFGGKPIERRSSFDGEEEQIYGNRVSQLWCQAKPLVREGQITGIPREAVNEMCSRRFSPRSTKGKIMVESKIDMKKRTQESPDLSDAIMIMIEVAILNNLLDFEEVKSIEKDVMSSWRKFCGNARFNNPPLKKLSYR